MAKEQPKAKKTADDTSEANGVATKDKKPAPKFLRIITAPFRAIGRYVKGSWQELRQVQWPNRSATWSLTLAVILFTLFFAVLILALDSGFQYLFNRILL
ncbi:MAG TPA: preprotein translocase subunit SecE [Verrucomicrobiae bacterium]|nr:preprotein translocase subunit SecE [Verrucomicrobiae bacterium]